MAKNNPILNKNFLKVGASVDFILLFSACGANKEAVLLIYTDNQGHTDIIALQFVH